jgi:hypothetical protein
MKKNRKSGRQRPLIKQIVRGRRTDKAYGELAELAFVHKAASLGFGVAKPYGDSERYDFVLDSGERFWRVQVKSTCSAFGRGYRTASRRGRLHYYKPYRAKDIDFYACYISPLDIWYVIPVRKVAPFQALTFYPAGCNWGGGYFERYREAWYLMTPGGDSKPQPLILHRVRAISGER